MAPSRIYLSPPHMSGLEQQYIQETFASNWIAPLGPQVDNSVQGYWQLARSSVYSTMNLLRCARNRRHSDGS